MNFASYRQTELDNVRITAFGQLEPLPYLSKRFLLKRYLGLSESEIAENEESWREERATPELQTTQGQDMRSVGITPGGMEADIATGAELTAEPGAEAGGEPGAAPAPGGGAPGGESIPTV